MSDPMDTDSPADTTSRGSKRARSPGADDTSNARSENTPGLGGSKPAPGDSRPSKKQKQAGRAQASKSSPGGSDQWHVSQDSVPEEAKGIQNALHIHIRMLGFLVTSHTFPEKISGTEGNLFSERFSDAPGIRSAVDAEIARARDPSGAAQAMVTRLNKALDAAAASDKDKNKRSFIIPAIRRIVPDFLLLSYSVVTSLGLKAWNPDLGSAADSIYNLLHEQIALSTFKTLCLSYAYTAHRINFEELNKPVLLRKLYRNYVFSYLRKRFMKDSSRNGSVKESDELSNLYKRRKKLRKERVQYLKDQSYNTRVLRLFSANAANSED
ncbi:hypothetical protein FA95DRAFT_1614153, partial [Auriscalpium vulgare]